METLTARALLGLAFCLLCDWKNYDNGEKNRQQ